MGFMDWYRKDIRQNNDPPRLRFTNTQAFDDTPLGFFGEAVLDRLVKAGPTENQIQRSYMFFQRVGTERRRNSLRWKYRLTEWITWKIPLFRRFYNTNVNEATGKSHRSITDPRNGRKYLLTSGGRLTGRARKGWAITQILDRNTGQPVEPELQSFLQENGVFLGRNTWNYINQVGRILSEVRDKGTENERECFQYLIMAHDNNSGPLEALEDGTELYVRAFNSKGEWVPASQELLDRLFTNGYAKYPHYSGDIMQFFTDAWARAGSDLVTQRRLLEMQREADFGAYMGGMVRGNLQSREVNIYPPGTRPPPRSTPGGGSNPDGGGGGSNPDGGGGGSNPDGGGGGSNPDGGGGGSNPGGGGGYQQPVPAGGGSRAYYTNAGFSGPQQAVWQNDLPGRYGVGQGGYPASSSSGDGPQFRTLTEQLVAWMGTDQQSAAHALSFILGTAMGTVPNVGPPQQVAPTNGTGQGTPPGPPSQGWGDSHTIKETVSALSR